MSSFKKELDEAKKKLDLDKTGIMDSQVIKDRIIDVPQATDDFIASKSAVGKVKKLPEPPVFKTKPISDSQLLKRELLSHADDVGDRTLHKTTNMASKKAAKFVRDQQLKGIASRSVKGALLKAAPLIGGGLKLAAKVTGPLGYASDALASEDLGANEDQEIQKMKMEAKFPKLASMLKDTPIAPVSAGDQLAYSMEQNKLKEKQVPSLQALPSNNDKVVDLDVIAEREKVKRILGY